MINFNDFWIDKEKTYVLIILLLMAMFPIHKIKYFDFKVKPN